MDRLDETEDRFDAHGDGAGERGPPDLQKCARLSSGLVHILESLRENDFDHRNVERPATGDRLVQTTPRTAWIATPLRKY